MFYLVKRILTLSLFSSSLIFAQELKTYQFDIETKYGTTHFEVNFSEKNLKLAERIKQIAEKDLMKIVDYFEYAPNETIYINIDSNMRLTNGFARNFPINAINLYNFPANNQEHLIVLEDWWRGLIMHEFTHIIHLDQTRGFLNTGRKIFGTIAKIPVGIVPRWFSEGIAVWSESHLYKSGRLQNPFLNKELWMYLKDSKNCTRIDCIDESGNYPFGQLSYWIGGHFLEYIENQKAGNIRCLVEENSKELPFFLNKVFEKCTGKNAEEQFENFKYYYLKKFEPVLDESEAVNENFGKVIYQKGTWLQDKRLYRVERTKLNEALVWYDLENKVSMNQQYSHYISDIAGHVNLDSENSALVVSFNDDPNYKIANKSWSLINDETLLEEKKLNFKNDPSYVLPINKDEYITLSYQKNIWIMNRVQKDGEDFKDISQVNFASADNIVYAKLINNKIILKIYNYVTDKTNLVVSNSDFSEQKVIYSSNNFFEIMGETKTGFIIRENKDVWYFQLNDKEISKEALDNQKYANTTFIWQNENVKLSLDHNLMLKKDIGFSVVGKKEIVQGEALNHEVYPDENLNTEKYFHFNHYRPHYWFFNYDYSNNLSSVGAFTTFSDPLEINNFNLSANFYPDISRLGGKIIYSFKGNSLDLTNLSNTNYFDFIFNQEYSQNNIKANYVNRTRSVDFNYRLLIDQKRLHFVPSFIFGVENTSDFLSDRNTKYIGLRGVGIYAANTNYDLLNEASLITRMTIDTPSNGDGYVNFQNKLETTLKLQDNFFGSLRMAWGKLYKTDFKRGVLYGGGLNTWQTVRWFEFYGLPYGDSYGNELNTERLKFDYNFLNIYKGYGLVPLSLKELHLVFGVERLAADVIYINKHIYRNESINSLFIGLMAKTAWFYQVPVDIELILSTTTTPTNDKVGQGSMVVNAGVF